MDLKHLKEFTIVTEVTADGFFKEAQHYGDSGEFTDEFYELFAQVTKMKKIMKHPKWLEYFRATDRNFNSDTEGSAKEAINAITDLENALIDIDRELDRASLGDDSRQVSPDEMDDDK